jgi:hypothetical protein
LATGVQGIPVPIHLIFKTRRKRAGDVLSYAVIAAQGGAGVRLAVLLLRLTLLHISIAVSGD